MRRGSAYRRRLGAGRDVVAGSRLLAKRNREGRQRRPSRHLLMLLCAAYLWGCAWGGATGWLLGQHYAADAPQGWSWNGRQPW